MKVFVVLLGLVMVAGCGRTGNGDPGDLPPAGGSNTGANDEGSNDAADDEVDTSNDDSANDDGANTEEPDDTPVLEPIEPIYPKDGFCNTGGMSWGWCEDFDGQGTSGPVAFDAAASAIALHSHSHGTMTGTLCETSGDCSPYVQGGSLFLNAEDGGFAMNVLRVEQPFDFENREGRVHYRSSMQGHGRMHQDIHITPTISNTLPDLRFVDKPRDGDAIDIDFVGDGGWPFTIVVWRDGAKAYLAHANGPIGVTSGVQQDIDVYVSRSHLSVRVDGVEVFDSDEHPGEDGAPFPDLGFTRGYVHFAQLAYNPVKDGYYGDAPNTFLWDDLAFDGPSLPRNGLTPVGKKEVLFRAWNKASCTVRGLAADGPVAGGWYIDTWHVQVDAGQAIAMDDITCIANPDGSGQPDPFPTPYGQPFIDDLLFVVR
ncbi:MAG: hypothetical protein ACAI38_23125 [Myxococcota bacterium]|nr:hypothetical protein [Myxococcota bacterium]